MRYPGGKGKTYQHIINILPRHQTYIETHLGGGAVLRHKKPSIESIGIDRDPAIVEFWRLNFPNLASYVEADAAEFLASRRFNGTEVLYCDPPYLPSTRCSRRVYRCEYSCWDHQRLLEVLKRLPSNIVISGYPSALYDRYLRGWNTLTFAAKAHNGVRLEKLWFNFARPNRLHDSRYLGADYRERQTIRRRLNRLKRRISSLSSEEQHVVAEWLGDQLCST